MAPGNRNINPKHKQIRKNPPPSTSKTSSAKATPEVAISKNKYFIPAVLFLLCFLLYGNTLRNGYAFDDPIFTTQNTYITQGFSAIKDIFNKDCDYGYNKVNAGLYRPLVLLSFMTEHAAFGFNPHVSHFINILLFALTVVLLYFFLQKILKNYNKAIIIAATLLFAFHPIHTEVTANIKSRDEILSLLLGLIAFYGIMLYQENNKSKYYIISLTSFFLALFCKETALTFVVIIPLLLYFFTQCEIKKIAVKSIPYFTLAIIYLSIRFLVLHGITITNKITVMDNALMAAKNIGERTATSFVLMGKYIYMTIIPYPLSWDYCYNQIPIVSWGNIKPILSLLVCGGLVGFMILGLKKKSIWSFLIALFFITIFLSSNLVIIIGWTFGERFLYVPSLSFCIAFPILLAKAIRFNPTQLVWKKKNSFYIPIAVILIIYTAIVIPRNAVWNNDFTLFSSGVITAPNSYRTHATLGANYKDTAKVTTDHLKQLQLYSLSAHEFKKATEIYDKYAEGYYFAGLCYFYLGYQDSAIDAYKKALAINPVYPQALYNLGVIYFNKQEYQNAIPYLTMAYKTDSSSVDILVNLGASYEFAGNYAMAFHIDSLALKKDPDNQRTLSNMEFMRNAMSK